MLRRSTENRILPPILLGSLACLQPGIDPVFLTLLSSAHDVLPARHGWIVASTQTGMAVGSLVAWRFANRLGRTDYVLAALVAFAASVITVADGAFAALILARASYGFGMGMLYTQAMSTASLSRASGAYGAVFLLQLLLSTLMAVLLPSLASAVDARSALVVLCAVPLCAILIIIHSRSAIVGREPHRAAPRSATFSQQQNDSGPPGAAAPRPWALATASLLVIAATMMVWSFTSAMALEAGIAQDIVGNGVAIGSLAGAVTALAVMREHILMPPSVTAILAGSTLLLPLAAIRPDANDAFLVTMILFNIGSTAIIIRCSGLAVLSSRNMAFRRFVSCTHPMGMILGPAAASLASTIFGRNGLAVCAVACVALACSLMIVGTRSRARSVDGTTAPGIAPEPVFQ